MSDRSDHLGEEADYRDSIMGRDDIGCACLTCRRTPGGCSTHRAAVQPSLEQALRESVEGTK